MDPVAAAAATAPVVGNLSTHFMMDLATYQRGAELGFTGADFYTVGRGGALGDVHADVVASAFVFFAPAAVAETWDRGRAVMAPTEAADHFLAVGHDWAEGHLGDDADLPRLADLVGRLTAAANPASAPLFAAWRARPEPGADRPRALAFHRLNVLRELRGALHGAAVLAHGLGPHEAVTLRSPHMLGIFGWDGPHPDAGKRGERPEWAAAEAATDRALGRAYAALGEAERVELCDLAATLYAPLQG
ncbi:MAG TPA: hypothetical protein VEW93_15040 [Acidimicrobiales bacterium]|nr:hypothetical protein [Acidimicrobiales bacterium]